VKRLIIIGLAIILLVVSFCGCVSATTPLVVTTTPISSGPQTTLTVLPLASVIQPAEVGNSYVGAFLDQNLQCHYVFYVQNLDGSISIRDLSAEAINIKADGLDRLDEYTSPQIVGQIESDTYYYVLHIPAGTIIYNFGSFSLPTGNPTLP
jgi:hypothetical protein